MKKISIGTAFSLILLFAGVNRDIQPVVDVMTSVSDIDDYMLAGTMEGLFCFDSSGYVYKLWDGGEVKKALPVPYGTFLMTSEGVIFSDNLTNWEERNEGLNTKYIKHYRDGEVTFTTVIQDLKDLEFDPVNPDNLVACSKESIYVSTNRGVTWDDYDTPSWTMGMKSVSVFTEDGLQVLMGHPYQGIFHMDYTSSPGTWSKMCDGLYEYDDVYEEVADIYAGYFEGELTVFAANNFSPYLYELDLTEMEWETVYEPSHEFDVIDSLFIRDNKLFFVNLDDIMVWDIESRENHFERSVYGNLIYKYQKRTRQPFETVAIVSNQQTVFMTSELWMLNEPEVSDNYYTAEDKKGVYMPGYIARQPDDLDEVLDIMSNTGMNMITIDMKDDSGYLRFTPTNDVLLDMAYYPYPVDLDTFVPMCRERGIYLVARIVLFKDKWLYEYNNNEFAIKDRYTGKGWQGYTIGSDGATNQVAEYWVDPYSEDVWEYNLHIAQELIERGFDEIQFDYIRFPTDGINKWRATYDYKEEGMDKESALMSFLSYARENIDVPVSIDIYGSNGWHRISGVTGQDVELLSEYADVICPMYYPSHFGQDFLDQDPAEMRPFRIYYYGNFRNYYMARKTVVVRPWVQAFYLGVSYDRKYYNAEYIVNEIRGVEWSLNMGYTYWNSGGDYADVKEAFIDEEE